MKNLKNILLKTISVFREKKDFMKLYFLKWMKTEIENSISPLFRSGNKKMLKIIGGYLNYRLIWNFCSIVTNLDCLSRCCIASFKKEYQVDVVYTDFSKAFY